eukprot:bmy_02869T0
METTWRGRVRVTSKPVAVSQLFDRGEGESEEVKENDRNLHLNYMEFDVNTRYPSDIKLQGGWKYNCPQFLEDYESTALQIYKPLLNMSSAAVIIGLKGDNEINSGNPNHYEMEEFKYLRKQKVTEQLQMLLPCRCPCAGTQRECQLLASLLKPFGMEMKTTGFQSPRNHHLVQQSTPSTVPLLESKDWNAGHITLIRKPRSAKKGEPAENTAGGIECYHIQLLSIKEKEMRELRYQECQFHKGTRKKSTGAKSFGCESIHGTNKRYNRKVLKNGTHNKHCDQKILLGDLSVREDVVQYSVHVTLVLLPKGEHAFVIVTCKQQKEVVLTHRTGTLLCIRLPPHHLPKKSDSYPAAKERIWKAVSIHHVDQIIQDIVEYSMELLASECCALDPWQTACVKLSLSIPMRDQVIHYLLFRSSSIPANSCPTFPPMARKPNHHPDLDLSIALASKHMASILHNTPQNGADICTISGKPTHTSQAIECKRGTLHETQIRGIFSYQTLVEPVLQASLTFQTSALIITGYPTSSAAFKKKEKNGNENGHFLIHYTSWSYNPNAIVGVHHEPGSKSLYLGPRSGEDIAIPVESQTHIINIRNLIMGTTMFWLIFVPFIEPNVVFRCDHDNKSDCTFVSKHLIRPPADRPHAFHCCNAIVGNENLGQWEHGNWREKKFPTDTRKSSNQIAHKFQGLAVNVLLFFKVTRGKLHGTSRLPGAHDREGPGQKEDKVYKDNYAKKVMGSGNPEGGGQHSLNSKSGESRSGEKESQSKGRNMPLLSVIVWGNLDLQSIVKKWNTDNTLGTEITIEDQICQGLKLTSDTTFSPNTGKKSSKIKSSYKRECINLGCDVGFDFAGPAIHGSAVFGYEGWLAGHQMTFDSAKSKLTRNNFAVGYRTGDFQLHTNINDGTEFGGSIYQKVCEDLDT